MQSAPEQDAWVLRVLGVASTPGSEPASDRATADLAATANAVPARKEPFELFVKSLDGVTLKIALPDEQRTTLGQLQGLIEDRTGIAPGEQNLTTGTKPFNSRHAQLPVAEYGIQRNQTLSLLGRLKGGFGERAAVAEAMLKDTKHANVLGDLQATQGESKAKKDLRRRLLNEKDDLGKQFRGYVGDLAVSYGAATEEDKDNWIDENFEFIAAIGVDVAKSGNCGDYAHIVYTNIASNTKDQTVYEVQMEDPYDHQFVVTSPDDHGNSVTDLINDPEAMVVDAWWENRICAFSKFVDGNNPYYEKISPDHFSISICTRAKGTPPLDPRIEAAARSKIEEIYKAQEPELKETAKEIGVQANDIARLKKEVDQYKQTIARLSAVMVDPRADDNTREEAEVDLTIAESDLNDTRGLLRDAKQALPDIFGSPDAPWDTASMRDQRKPEELHWALNKAFKAGGHDQLEKEMAHLSDKEFIGYLVDSDRTQEWVLSSVKLGARFKRLCNAADPDTLRQTYALLTPTYKALYVDSDEELVAKLNAAGLSGADTPIDETV
jgi:hypothetical protein